MPKSRRRELGLYVGRMSALSSWQILEKKGKVKSVGYGPHLILGVALALLAGLREMQSEAMSNSVKPFCSILFGPTLDTARRAEKQGEGDK